MHYINTLQDGDDISDIYYCKMKKSAQSKYGKTYYSLVLQDKTGTIDAKVWTLNKCIIINRVDTVWDNKRSE